MSLQTVPLSQIEPPQANPRQAFDSAGISELADSIRENGLLNNLVVKPKRGGKRFSVVAGGRRFAALCSLRDAGDLPEDHPVPVNIRKGLKADDALQLAGVENMLREDLHPLEESELLAELARKGESCEDLAERIGMSLTTVYRRLALQGLSSPAREALIEGDLSLAQAQALCLGTEEQQDDILDGILRGFHFSPAAIRKQITGARPTVADAAFDLDRYQGTFTRDLFGEEETTYFDDLSQFFELQNEAVEQLAEEHGAKAAWVEIVQDQHFPRYLYRSPEADSGEQGGVVIHYPPTGQVKVHENLVEIRPAKADSAGSEPEPGKVSERPAFSMPALDYFANHLTAALIAKALEDPRRAKEAALFQLVAKIKLELHPFLDYFAAEEPESASEACGTVLETALPLLSKLLGEPDDVCALLTRLQTASLGQEQLFDAVQALEDDELDRLLYLLPLLTFGTDRHSGYSGRYPFRRLAEDLELDMTEHWSPDDIFLKRCRRDQLIGFSVECGADEALNGTSAKLRKKDLAAAIKRHFKRAREASKPATHERKALQWLPAPLRPKGEDEG